MDELELEDLLASIRAESKKESALSLYEGTQGTDLVDEEEVDERILRLLGLDDVFDIDYDTYKSLLREKVAAARMTGSQMATEESELVTDEYRRVKSKVGRFKLKKKRINLTEPVGEAPSPISARRLLPGRVDPALPPGAEDGSSELKTEVSDIGSKLDDLLDSVRAQFKLEEEQSKKAAITAQNLRRRTREDKLESGDGAKKAIKDSAKKALAPFTGILDKILRFLGFTALGFVFDKFYKWWTNPENQSKVETLGRFLQDWWPSLSAAALLFLTPLGGFIRGTIRTIRTLIPKLVNLIRLNPLASLAVVGGTLAIGKILSDGGVPEEPTGLTREEAETSGAPTSFADQSGGLGAFSEGGMIPRFRGRRRGIPTASQGAKITANSGETITGAGADTQLIAAQPGEMVMPVETVNKYGSNFFMNLIKSTGKSGIPGRAANIQFMNQGGMVGDFVNAFSFLPGTGTVMAPITSPATQMDSQGRRGATAGYQRKFLGMNIGEPMYPVDSRGMSAGYSDTEKRRFEKFNPNKQFVPTFGGRGADALVDANTNDNLIRDAFRDFGKNVQTLKDYGKRQREMLEEIMPGRFSGSMNMRGVQLGPQSSIAPVGTPVISSQTQMIVLPQKTTIQPRDDGRQEKETDDIPTFNIIAKSPGRNKVISALGIQDLVGA